MGDAPQRGRVRVEVPYYIETAYALISVIDETGVSKINMIDWMSVFIHVHKFIGDEWVLLGSEDTDHLLVQWNDQNDGPGNDSKSKHLDQSDLGGHLSFTTSGRIEEGQQYSVAVGVYGGIDADLNDYSITDIVDLTIRVESINATIV